MNFKNWLESVGLVNSIEDALHTLGLEIGASEKEIRKAHRDLSMRSHPDRGGSIKVQAKANSAFDFLKEKGFNTSGSRQEFRPHSRHRDTNWGNPPWQTDSRSSYNEVGENFRNLNFCMKSIYEKAIEIGPVERWTIQAFDGSYFRNSFVVFCNPETLGFAGKVMEEWNSHGANPYRTNAVFANQSGSKDLILVRIRGRDVSKEDIIFTHDAFNENPGNDANFVRDLKNKLKKIEDDLGMGIS
jgi:curved DNA-binding protein CbpA